MPPAGGNALPRIASSGHSRSRLGGIVELLCERVELAFSQLSQEGPVTMSYRDEVDAPLPAIGKNVTW